MNQRPLTEMFSNPWLGWSFCLKTGNFLILGHAGWTNVVNEIIMYITFYLHNLCIDSRNFIIMPLKWFRFFLVLLIHYLKRVANIGQDQSIFFFLHRLKTSVYPVRSWSCIRVWYLPVNFASLWFDFIDITPNAHFTRMTGVQAVG